MILLYANLYVQLDLQIIQQEFALRFALFKMILLDSSILQVQTYKEYVLINALRIIILNMWIELVAQDVQELILHTM